MVCVCAVSLPASAQTESPRELYKALNDLRVDPAKVYAVRELHLRRDAVGITLGEGKLAFLTQLDGRVSGAVFTGRGRVISTPREAAERQSMAQFLGVPLLDQGFSRGYLRFTDDTAAELSEQLGNAGGEAANDSAFVDGWNAIVADLNREHSLRVMADWLAAEPRPYFYAELLGDVSGPFDVLVDQRREEEVLLGQPRRVGNERFYNVWASFRRGGAPEKPPESFVPVDYTIQTKIREDRVIEGQATMRLKARESGERVVVLELSRYLQVQSATDGAGHSLDYFQNAGLNRNQMVRSGNDWIAVVLPERSKADEEFELNFEYRGSVISDAGNGVYFVGDRGSWYPHILGPDHFVTFDLKFRWPKRLTLVATGAKIEEHEEGSERAGHWHSIVPCALLGFNLGDYVREDVAGKPAIALFANRQLEDALMSRLHRRTSDIVEIPGNDIGPRRQVQIPTPPPAQLSPPSPAAELKQLGANILDSIHYFEKLNGPFPFEHLEVSQIPGSFGQGWPGLLYLSTLVFLPAETQQSAGLGPRAREEFSELVPYHEVAHQWWGNEVGVQTYRETWLVEAMSNYLALMYADNKKPGEHFLTRWLETYRTILTTKKSGEEESPEQAGPVTLGYRLSSSKSPDAYDAVIYGKGTWIVHMLRMMLREPGAKDPDARFVALLHRVLEQHRFQSLSNEDFQRAVQRTLTPAMDLEGTHSMDWFFDQWVRGTEIPRYSVNFEVKPRGKEFLIRGTLKQRDVSDLFIASVPIYLPGGRPVLLGHVVTTGPETKFEFVSASSPRRLLIDPQLTLLCRTD